MGIWLLLYLCFALLCTFPFFRICKEQQEQVSRASRFRLRTAAEMPSQWEEGLSHFKFDRKALCRPPSYLKLISLFTTEEKCNDHGHNTQTTGRFWCSLNQNCREPQTQQSIGCEQTGQSEASRDRWMGLVPNAAATSDKFGVQKTRRMFCVVRHVLGMPIQHLPSLRPYECGKEPNRD